MNKLLWVLYVIPNLTFVWLSIINHRFCKRYPEDCGDKSIAVSLSDRLGTNEFMKLNKFVSNSLIKSVMNCNDIFQYRDL